MSKQFKWSRAKVKENGPGYAMLRVQDAANNLYHIEMPEWLIQVILSEHEAECTCEPFTLDQQTQTGEVNTEPAMRCPRHGLNPPALEWLDERFREYKNAKDDLDQWKALAMRLAREAHQIGCCETHCATTDCATHCPRCSAVAEFEEMNRGS